MDTFEIDLQAFRSDWIARDQALSTIDEYCRLLRKYHEQYPDTLTLSNARAFLMSEQARSKSTARYASRALKAFSKWYTAEYDEDVDPLAKLALFKEPTAKKTPVATADDIAKLLATCDSTDFADERDRAIILVLRDSGMRRGEVCRMMMEDIDWSTGGIRIPKTKNGDVRYTRIGAEALRALRKYRHKMTSPYVWESYRGGQLTDCAMRQMLERRCEEAGIKLSAHAFRRGLAVNWLRKGGSETYLRAIAGWKSPAMVGRYTKLVAQEEAVNMHKALFG